MERQIHKMKTDPVCGRKVDPHASGFAAFYDQRDFYFCSQGCLDHFHQDGKRYARKGLRGLWSRYLDRVQKATDGKPPCCH